MNRMKDNTNDHIVSTLVPIAPILASYLFAEECGILRITCKPLETLPPFRNATPTPMTFLMKVSDVTQWPRYIERIQGYICNNGHAHIRIMYHLGEGSEQWQAFYLDKDVLHINVSHIAPFRFRDVYDTVNFVDYTQMGTKPLCYIISQMQKFGSSISIDTYLLYNDKHCRSSSCFFVSCWSRGRKCSNATHGPQCWN